ncbi:hypothetical protein [Streptomyces anulatus]|uniref:hypothetical protein n=1 Tax=Streptomyces anulatus TaxID=1892 RepID=UPI0037DC96C7|nr:hypothetical protein OHB50_39545 [Streptomyces anulatus]
MSTAPTDVLAASARSVAVALAPSADHLAPVLTCYELNELLDLFAAVGFKGPAALWIKFHEGDDQCEGHTVPAAPAPDAPAPERPLYGANGEYTPEPGTEYPFSVSDIARAVSALLGDAWTAESGSWGTTGTLSGPFIGDFAFGTDYESDLTMSFSRCTDDNWPESPTLPEDFHECDGGVYLELASASDGLEHLAEKYAAAVRAITGT